MGSPARRARASRPRDRRTAEKGQDAGTDRASCEKKTSRSTGKLDVFRRRELQRNAREGGILDRAPGAPACGTRPPARARPRGGGERGRASERRATHGEGEVNDDGSPG